MGVRLLLIHQLCELKQVNQPPHTLQVRRGQVTLGRDPWGALGSGPRL